MESIHLVPVNIIVYSTETNDNVTNGSSCGVHSYRFVNFMSSGVINLARLSILRLSVSLCISSLIYQDAFSSL